MYFLKDKGCYYFPEIAPLYRTMRASDVDIDRFSFAFAGAKFDVVFAINRKPFELMFGCVGHGKCNFILTMEKGYMLSPISDEVFETLCRVLHLSYRGDRFTSYKFLQHVASKVPQKYKSELPSSEKSHMSYVVAFVSCTKYIRAPHDGQANGIHSIIGYLLLTILKIHAKSNERLCCARRSVNSES